MLGMSTGVYSLRSDQFISYTYRTLTYEFDFNAAPLANTRVGNLFLVFLLVASG
jgi:hypothetical protein